jgi:hypothetical protein
MRMLQYPARKRREDPASQAAESLIAVLTIS